MGINGIIFALFIQLALSHDIVSLRKSSEPIKILECILESSTWLPHILMNTDLTYIYVIVTVH